MEASPLLVHRDACPSETLVAMRIIQRFASLLAAFLGKRTPLDGAGIEFHEAIEAHLEWKRRLINTVAGWSTGILKQDEVGTDAACALGQWIKGPGARHFSAVPSFMALQSRHEDFHRIAGQIVSLAERGQVGEAQDLLNGDFRRASSDVVALLQELSYLSER